MPSVFRNAVIRVSAINNVHADNDLLKVKKGDVVKYTLSDIINILNIWSETKDIKYYVIEHNENPDNIHFHIVISFSNDSVCKFETIKNKFPYGDIEGCRYGVKLCVQYLIHMNHPDKHQYSWEDVITNAPDRLENYKIPGKANENAKLKALLEKIVSGEIKECDMDKIESQIYIKNNAKIRNAFDYRMKTLMKESNRDVQVIVIQGPPRVGKSTFCKVYAEKNNKSICFSSSSNDAWQDYCGQDIFVYDDFNFIRTKIEDFLKALDPHNLTSVSARYRNKLFIGDTIFICTNTPIVKWYTWVDDVLRRALYARVSYVLDFIECKDGITYYTVNDIVDTGKKDYYDPYPYNHELEYARMQLKCREDENKPREFNLNKYINYNADTNKAQDFIDRLNEI